MKVNTNISSLAAQRSARKLNDEIHSSTRALASGKRINSASDDAAGLSISEKMNSNIRSTNQAKRNAGDGISLLQTIEGGLNEVSAIFIRLKELAVQSASDTISNKDRQFSNMEFEQLKNESKRILESTNSSEKNMKLGTADAMGRQLLDVATQKIDIQIGIHGKASTDTISFSPNELLLSHEDLNFMGWSITTKEDARLVLENIDQDLNKIASSRTRLGALQTRLSSSSDSLSVQSQNESSANSLIRDADMAHESALNLKSKFQLQATMSVLTQANSSGKEALKLIG